MDTKSARWVIPGSRLLINLRLQQLSTREYAPSKDTC
jgi:hypothetical protein